MALWSWGFARSHDKVKPLYLQYRSAYGHQIWEVGNLPWGTPTLKVTWSFNHAILVDHVANWKNISLLSQYLWPPNLATWWHTIKSSHSWSYMIFQSRVFVKLLDKLSLLYLHLYTFNSHKHGTMVTYHEKLAPIQ